MNDNELDDKSASEIVRLLGRRYSTYRRRMKFTQKQVSEQSGLSIFTISSFENGSGTGISLASFTRMLRAIGCLDELTNVLPELPVSPALLYKKQKSRRGGVKNGNEYR